MATEQIKVEQGRMKLLSQRFDADGERIKIALDRLNQKLEEVKPFFKGEGSDEFYRQYETAEKEMRKVFQELKRVGKEIEGAAKDLTESDIEAAKEAKAINQ